MNIANIIKFDTGNARGISVVVFVSGCEHHCPECHNPETWNPNYGERFTFEKSIEITKALNNPHIKNLVISGGDPLHPENVKEVCQLILATKSIRDERNQNLIIYTGYTLEELKESFYSDKYTQEQKLALDNILSEVDYLIDGRYDKTKKTKGLDYRGSYNQRCWHFHDLGYGDKGIMDISDYYFKEGSKYNDNTEAW